jgi:hypothetical protein
MTAKFTICKNVDVSDQRLVNQRSGHDYFKNYGVESKLLTDH